jgi:hypothetical protein
MEYENYKKMVFLTARLYKNPFVPGKIASPALEQEVEGL